MKRFEVELLRELDEEINMCRLKNRWELEGTETEKIIEGYRTREISKQHIVKTPGKVVAEYGCGQGRTAAMLAPRTRKYYGIDLSEKQLEYARKYCKAGNIEWICTDCTKKVKEIEDESVNYVISCDTLEHVNDIDGYFKEINRVMKMGGVLSLLTPSTHLYYYPSYFIWALKNHPIKFRERMKPLEDWERAVKYHPAFKKEDLIELVKEYGFHVYSHKYVLSFYDQHYVKRIGMWYEKVTGRVMPGLRLWLRIHSVAVWVFPFLGARHVIKAVKRC